MSNNIYLEVNGTRYEGFTDVSITKSLTQLSNQFTFLTTVKDGFTRTDEAGFSFITGNLKTIQNDLKVQDDVRIYIDDNLIITGYIEDLNIAYSSNSHSISVAGRDQTGDLVDCSPIKEAYKITSFVRWLRKLLDRNGYSHINIVNNIGVIDPLATKPEDFSGTKAETHDSIASYIDSYAKKVQVLVLTNEEGDLVITREGSDDSGGSLINNANGNNNNILSCSINVNSTSRFREVQVNSQDDNKNFTATSVAQSGSALDYDIRSFRKKIVAYKKTTQSLSLKDYAKWTVNINKAKGSNYNCRVYGYYTEGSKGSIWTPNTLVQVKDDLCQINGQFLIESVTFTKGLDGSFTDLTIVNRGAYTVDGGIIANASDFASNLFKDA